MDDAARAEILEDAQRLIVRMVIEASRPDPAPPAPGPLPSACFCLLAWALMAGLVWLDRRTRK